MYAAFKSYLILMLFLGVTLSSCSPDEEDPAVTDDPAPVDELCLDSGDIVVSNSGSDALVVFNSDGTFKDVIFYVSSASENLYGLAWSAATEEVLVVVDGVDRVLGISAEDCSSRTVVLDVNLTGNVRGVTQLVNGDLLIVETNNLERFGSNGTRITSGWPVAAQSAGTAVSALANGGFVHCSTTTDVVRTYNNAGVQQATRTSGIAGTTDAAGCLALADGSVAAAWSGTTDTVSFYSASLSPVASYSNTSVIGAPGGLSQKSNGNILAVDRVYNYVVEITTAGALVGTFGSGYLATPEFILVVP